MSGAAELEGRIEAAVAHARQRWPAIRLGAAEAASAIRSALDKSPDPSAALALLHTDDLYLAAACGLGDPAALAAFEAQLLPAALRVAARIDASRDFVDEVAQQVRRRLLTAEAGKRPRIATYGGRASLESWMRAVALRAASGLRESQGRERTSLDERLGEVAAGESAEFDMIRAQLTEEFRQSFGAALANLPRRMRTLLRMHVVEGVTLDGLALAYGAHRATIARWLAAARSALLKGTRARLAGSLKLKPEEVDSLIELARSQLEISISRFLDSNEDLPKK